MGKSDWRQYFGGEETMTLSGDFLFLTIGIVSVLLSCFASMSIMLSMRIGAMFSWLAFLIIGLNVTGPGNSIKGVIIGLSVVMIIMHLIQFFTFTFSKGREKNSKV